MEEVADFEYGRGEGILSEGKARRALGFYVG